MDHPMDDYAELRQKLSRAVASICPPWLANQREDLVQVTLMRAMEIRRKSGENQELSSSYIRRMAYNALIDEIRRLRRCRQEVSLEEVDQEKRPITADGPGPEQKRQGREIGENIRACLGRLVKPRRLAVTLHLLGHTVPQTAKILGWNPKQADNLVYRGLADLRRYLCETGMKP